MILINFSTVIKENQIRQAEGLLHEAIDRVVNFNFRIDDDRLIQPQFNAAMESFPLSDDELRNEPIAIVLPGQNYLTALILVELHARMAYFPPILRVRLQPYGLPPRFEVVELVDLQKVEDDYGGLVS